MINKARHPAQSDARVLSWWTKEEAMKKIVILSVAIGFLAIFAGACHAADKLGYVDLGRLFDEYNKTKAYDKVLEDKQKVYETERDKKVNDLKALQSKIDILSEKEKEAKKPEFDTKVKALQEYQRVQETELRKDRDDKMKEILKDIEKAVGEYAKKENFTMIFNDRVLVYQDQSMDITEPALKILQSYYTAAGK
jgi:outer membrane protein